MTGKKISILGMLLLWTIGLTAQTDLVALQKKEKERRKKMKPSVLVLTDETLANKAQGDGKLVTTVGIAASTEQELPLVNGEAAPASQAGQPSSVEEPPAPDRSYWVGLKRAHDEAIGQQKEKIKDLELQIEKEVIARASESNPVKYNEMAEEINQMQVSKSEESKKLEDMERDWENVLKEAGEKGVPANWLSD